MPLVPFVSGSKFLMSSLNAAFDVDRTCFMTGDQSVISNIVLTNVAQLVLPVVASAQYALDSLIIYDTNATANMQLKFALPAGSVDRTAIWVSGTGALTADATIFHQAADSITWTVGGVAAGTYMTARPGGVIYISSTSGNMQVQFAQSTSTAVNTLIKGGSWVRLRRVL